MTLPQEFKLYHYRGGGFQRGKYFRLTSEATPLASILELTLLIGPASGAKEPVAGNRVYVRVR